MITKKIAEKINELFSDKVDCHIQDRYACNICFHSLEGIDYQHICWLLLLLMRDDYKGAEADILKELKKELNTTKENKGKEQ